MIFKLTVLGCNSAIPTVNRHPTAHLLNVNERFFLIDCGEGTQVQLRRYGIKIQRINHIFISHLHGDHYFGLIGLMSTMHLLGREKELTIFSTPGLKEIIELQLKASESWLCYRYNFVEITNENQLFEDKYITVNSIRLNHRIPCFGFVFREKEKERALDIETINALKIPYTLFNDIKKGKDIVLDDGSVIPNEDLTFKPVPLRSFAYCSDTCYDESLIEKIQNVDLLYHEATFSEEHLERAKKTFHSTAKQAGTIARLAKVKQLLIGHYSSRYKSTELLLEEAKSEFSNTVAAEEGSEYFIEEIV